MFTKATKTASRLRAAVFGPPGAGKTFSALRIATGIGGKIAVIDSEYGSAAKYSDRFDFDTLTLENPTIEQVASAIEFAGANGYTTVIIDSMTHPWRVLQETVEKISKARYGGNYWAAWSEGNPMQARLVKAILSSPCHVIATMRSKIEYVMEEGRNGKQSPKRVGLAPEQGKGIEYEFDVLLEINHEHMGTVTKDRTGKFQDQIIERPGEEFGAALRDWLAQGAPMPERPAPTPEPAAATEHDAQSDPRPLSAPMKALFGAIRAHEIPEETQAKWLEHFKVPSLLSLSDVQASALLSKIESMTRTTAQ